MKHSAPATLTDLLRQRAEEHPARLALIFKERRWSYAEFKREADRLATGFARLGVKKSDHVALLLPNCPEFLFSVFALTKMGAVFVPLNPQYTAEEAQYVLHHSEASVVLTAPELLPVIDSSRGELPR